MHLRLIFLFSTFISVLKGDELPLAPYNVKLFCRTGERNVSTKGLSPPIECPSSSSSCGYLEFETKDPRFSKNAGKVGLFECVDSGILHQENDEYDDDKETESIFGEICGPIPRCSLLHLRAFNPNFLKYVIASQNIQLKMIAKPTVKFCCALYHSTLSRLVNSGNDQLPSITAPAVHCGDLECGQGAIGCLLHSRYGKKGEFDGKRERLAKEKMEMEKDEESFEEYEVDEEELVIPSGSQSRLFTNRVITGSRKRRAVQDDYEDQIKAVEISFGEDEDTYLKGMDVIESGGPGPRSTALPYTSIESLEDENENDGTHHCVYRHLNDERYRYCLLIHSEKDGDRCYEHKGHSICCCFVPPDQNTCDPTDLDLVVPAPSLAPKKRITTTFATTIKSDIELKETAKSDEGFLETLTTTTTTTTTSPPPREQIPATEDPILVTTTLSTTMMTKKRKGRPRITVKAPSTSPNLRNGCRIVYPGPRRNDGIHIWTRVERLRRQDPAGKRTFIPSPFGHKLSFARLAHQLESPIVETLNGWRFICKVAKAMCEPLRLTMAEAVAEQRDRLEACKEQLEEILSSDEFWADCETWFEDGDGGYILNVLHAQVTMMEAKMASRKVGYDQVERPVADHSDAVNVSIRILLQQLVDVDERNQVVTLVIWTQMTWYDYKMKWDPKEYGNITKLQLPSGSLWKPDVLLFNTADEHFDASFPVNMAVSSNGEVLMAPPSVVRMSCTFDLTYFPFDDQVCYLKYGSWTYTGRQVDLTIDNSGLTDKHQMDLLYYVPNGEWELLATPAERVANEFHGEKYVELYFRFHIKRRTLYYGLNWVVPSVLISLSNVLGFTLPTECGEKLTLQITNLLAVLVFLGMVSEIIPPSSESIPVVVAFFSASLLLLGLSAICTVLIINVHFRNPKTHKLSNTMRNLFLEWLPWLLLMTRPGKTFAKPRKYKTVIDSNFPEGSFLSGEFSMQKSSFMNESDRDDEWRERGNVNEIVEKRNFSTQRPRLLSIERDYAPLQAELREIIILMQSFKEKLDEDAVEEECQADYKYIAMCLDRMFLFVFSAAYLSTVTAMLIATPRVLSTSA
ncbi:unnamed protein product, partial [Mesorhabditis belari]|uniref:Uncharacterized protein n=1 Tax=Mesorhabditis belari TaxID=2138241 RepID=A0AAF3F335_9BILA